MMAWISEKIILHVKGQIKKVEGQKKKGGKNSKTKVYDFFTFSQNRLRITYRIIGVLNFYS